MKTIMDLQPKLWKDNCKKIHCNGTEAEENSQDQSTRAYHQARVLSSYKIASLIEETTIIEASYRSGSLPTKKCIIHTIFQFVSCTM
jgi:hypothetical protein